MAMMMMMVVVVVVLLLRDSSGPRLGRYVVYSYLHLNTYQF